MNFKFSNFRLKKALAARASCADGGNVTLHPSSRSGARGATRPTWLALAAIVVLFCAATLPNTVVSLLTYDSVADLAANANPEGLFKVAWARGYYASGDGGGGMFYATNTVTSTNLGTRIKAVSHASWSWQRSLERPLSSADFGLKGDDSTDNATALTSLISVLGPGVKVRWLSGTYRFNSTLTIVKSNWVWEAASPLGAKLKFTPASKQDLGIDMQGDGWRIDGLEIDWNQNSAHGLYCDNYHHGWMVVNSYIHGAYADHSSDPSDATEVANVAVRRGNYDWTIQDSDLSGADCAAAGTRTSAGLTATDLGYSVLADGNLNGLVRRVKFDQIGPSGLGDAIRFSLTQNYDCRSKVVDCDFGLTGFRAVKLICNGAVVAGNTFNNTDTGARAAIEDFGDNNVIENNSIVGTYAFGIAGGSGIGATTCRNGRIENNHVRFTGGAKTTGIGFRFTGSMGAAVLAGNGVTDASYGIFADGKFYGNLVLGTCLTNIVNNGIELASDGTNAPDRCQVDNTVAFGVGNFAVKFSAGSSLDCGLVTGAAVGSEVSYAAGVTGKLTQKIYGDGLWRDWNGVPMQGGGWILDECISPTLAGSIGWTSSTLNSGTAAVSSILDANHAGVYAVSNGGTTNGVGNIRNAGNNILFGSRTIRLVGCVKTPPVSSTADRYQIFFGFGDATTAANVDGAFFTYSDNLNSGNWTGQTMSASSTTTASGGSNVAVTGSAYWWLGIEGNSTSCKFYVAADASGSPGAWTLIGTSSATLPTSGTTGLLHMIIKQSGSTGTTTETFYMEKVFYQP
jgi:hypothetical protein